MCKLKCYYKDLLYFLKLSNLQRELMQNCWEECSKRDKASYSLNSNGSRQREMEQCQWSLVG